MSNPISDFQAMPPVPVDRLSDRLSAEEGRLRLALMNRIVDRGEPLCRQELAGLPELADFDLERTVPALIDKQVLVNDEGKILFVYPVSALPTPHRVHLADGREFYAMCAIDALGAAYTFRQDVVIGSRCSLCDEPVQVMVRNGELASVKPSGAHVLHVDLDKYSDWSGSC